MNILIYLIASFLISSFAFRALDRDRSDRARRAYATLCANVAVCYVCFALYLVTGVATMRHVHIIASLFIPMNTIDFLQRLLQRDWREQQRKMRLVALIVAAILILGLFASATLEISLTPFPDVPGSLITFLGLGWCLYLVWSHYRSVEGTQSRRIRFILIMMGSAIGLTFIEASTRVPGLWTIDPNNLTSTSMQGILPPISTVVTTGFLYLLYRIQEVYRLIDIQETLAKALTLVCATALLLFASGVTVYWIDGLTRSKVHGTFSIFLITLAFLSIFVPLRDRLLNGISQRLNRPGRRLQSSFREIDRSLAKVLTVDDLERELLGRLHESGRVPQTSLYLWDEGVYRLTLTRGVPAHPLLEAIADRPFTDGLRESPHRYSTTVLTRTIQRRLLGHDEATTWLQTMEAMDAEITLPIMSGDAILGWLNLKGDEWSEGFSHAEVRAIERLVDRTAVVLENLRGFEKLKEQNRLAALGTMSAGLAHEIRNPLAAIQGAAQYLQGDAPEEEIREYLTLIIEQTQRLNEVVRQFLNYARPFEVDVHPNDINALIENTLALIRAEGTPSTVELTTRLADDLPITPVDADRVQQILLNIIHNALHAIGTEGRVEIRTVLGKTKHRGSPSRPAVVIHIIDDGPGIGSDDMKNLFIPFFTTKPHGTGLGLAISRRLVIAHGGEIDVTSKVNHGCRFTIRFPITPPPKPSKA